MFDDINELFKNLVSWRKLLTEYYFHRVLLYSDHNKWYTVPIGCVSNERRQLYCFNGFLYNTHTSYH
jgi:hypothetical protein